MNTKVCAICNVEKPHIFYKLAGRMEVYRDEKGKRWVHMRCPECYDAHRKKLDAESKAKRTGKYATIYAR